MAEKTFQRSPGCGRILGHVLAACIFKRCVCLSATVLSELICRRGVKAKALRSFSLALREAAAQNRPLSSTSKEHLPPVPASFIQTATEVERILGNLYSWCCHFHSFLSISSVCHPKIRGVDAGWLIRQPLLMSKHSCTTILNRCYILCSDITVYLEG